MECGKGGQVGGEGERGVVGRGWGLEKGGKYCRRGEGKGVGRRRGGERDQVYLYTCICVCTARTVVQDVQM